MKIIDTPALTKNQIDEITRLTDVCCSHDQIRLTYPCDEAGNPDDAGNIGGACRHYLLYEADDTLSAILAMLPLDGQTAECSAFTHPAYRRQGYFTRLLEAAMERYEDYDILFGVPESCQVAKEVLSALGAELEAREHQMELSLLQPPFSVDSVDSCSGSHPGFTNRADLALVSSAKAAPSTATWSLMNGKTTIGRCLITPLSDTCVCLHQLEISEPLRNKGYGSSFLSLLVPRLAAAGTHKIVLQVSGSNPAAMALYQKTGFRITETLSFYCY